MKKLSKMVLLLGSVFLLTLFASCSNGSSPAPAITDHSEMSVFFVFN